MFPIIRGRDLRPVNSRKLCSNVTGSSYFVERLKLDRKLDVHTGCVNTVCWNDSGTLLLSGSDDQHFVISDPFAGKIVTKVRSGHRSNIFCARFLPGTHDREIVSCSGSGDIFYTDLDREDALLENRFGCHFGTTYKVVVVPNEASTFLSCGDDGTVRFFDLRVKTSCSRVSCEEDVIINLQNSVSSMAVDPVIPYQLAVGSADGVVRIYDRRMLKAREKGGNPKSLICVFQSPMSKTEKRHFRITSLNYRPGAHDVLVNYSSENIYLFNTYDMEIAQKYSVEIPKASTSKKTTILEDSTSTSTSTSIERIPENDEVDNYFGFSPEERRGPSTLYRPIKRLRLRGDWSDTGPNARPENEGQAPTSMIMQRMSDLLTRMLNTHVNEPLDDTARAQDSLPSGSNVTTIQGQTLHSVSPSGASSVVPISTSISTLRHRSLSEEQQSTPSEGLVSAELLPQESLNVGLLTEKVTSDDRQDEHVAHGSQDKGTPHSSQKDERIDIIEGENYGQNSVSDKTACRSKNSLRDPLTHNVPLDDDGPVESHFNTGDESTDPVNVDHSPIVECDKVHIVHNSLSSNNKEVFPISTPTAIEKCVEEEKSHDDVIMNLSVNDIERRDCNKAFTSCSNSFDCKHRHCISIDCKENHCVSKSRSCQSGSVSQSHASMTSLYTDTSNATILSHSVSEGNSSFAFAAGRPSCFGDETPSNTLNNISDLSMSSVTQSSTNSLASSKKERRAIESSEISDSITLAKRHFESYHSLQWSLDETSEYSRTRQSRSMAEPPFFQADESDDKSELPDSHPKQGTPNLYSSGSVYCSFNSIEEGEALGCESVKDQSQQENFKMEDFHHGPDTGNKMNMEPCKGESLSENKDSVLFASFEKKSGLTYSGKGKGIGKSSKKAQEKEQHDQQKRVSVPYNDGNMRFAVPETTETEIGLHDVDDRGVTAHSHSEATATLLSSSLTETEASNHITHARAEIENVETRLTGEGSQKVLNACPCDDAPSTSSSNRSRGSSAPADSQKSRHRRAGYSLPPTGNFQLHSDEENEDDEDDGATATRRGHQSKSHAARKIQELFRRRRHAKENAHMLNLPQPRVLMKFSGHRNCRTMIKESNFYGDEYVMSGSDCGRIFIWERETGKLAMYLEADKHVVNCVQPNPHLPVIASSGIDYDIKLWSPLAEESLFDTDIAHKIVQRNELMLVETRDTITVPPALMLRVLASLSHIRAGRTAAAQSQTDNEEQQPPTPGD